MDYKPKRRKIFKTQEVKELDKKHNKMQEILDRLGYVNTGKESPIISPDDYVKSLGW